MSNGSISNILRNYSNKEVAFRYHGCDLSFYLSQGLFSSYNVDAGSALLLKLIAKSGIGEGKEKIIDIGCGTGVLGLSLKKKYPQADITLQDRDALAVLFSKASAQKNKLLPKDAEESDTLHFSGGLAFEGLDDAHFDLIVSNWPAKAGAPVLREFFAQARSRSKEAGAHLAMVIVQPLKEQALAGAAEKGWEISVQEETVNHCAFIASAGSPADQNSSSQDISAHSFSLEPYLRTRFRGTGYTLRTAYGLSGFDTLPYHVALLAHEADTVLRRLRRMDGTTLIRNPGQGHIPMILAAASKKEERLPLPVRLASRDRLQLLVSARNLEEAGIPTASLEHDASLLSPSRDAGGANGAALAIIDLDPVPGSNTAEESWQWAENQLLPGGIVVFIGKSADLSRMSGGRMGFSLEMSKKHKGSRILVFSRNEKTTTGGQ
jgi:SAM-dependent methyltransferase